MLRLAAAGFLILHGLIHLSYLTPRPDDPKYPFRPEGSWFASAFGLSPASAKAIAGALAGIAVAASVLAGIGLLASADLWKPAAVVGAVASFVVLALTFHPWLTLGVLIDVVVVASVVSAHWPAALFE